MFAGWSSRERLALIISVSFIVVTLIAAIIIITLHGSDSATLISFIATLVSTINTIQLTQQRTAISALQQQTNGQQAKMLDSIIASPPAPTPVKEESNAVQN